MNTWFKGDEESLRAGKVMRLRARRKLRQAHEETKKRAALTSTKQRDRETPMTEGPEEKKTAHEGRGSKTKPRRTTKAEDTPNNSRTTAAYNDSTRNSRRSGRKCKNENARS